MSKEAFEKLASRAGIGPDTTIVLYGDNNNWFAAWGAWIFDVYGVKDVRLLDGGRKKWELEKRELSNRVADVKATAYNSLRSAQPNATSFVAGALIINGDSVGAAGSVAELVQNINRDAAGVTAVLNDDGTISLSNDTGANIVIAGSAPSNTGSRLGTYTGFVALTSVTGGDIKVQAKNDANGFAVRGHPGRRQGAGPERDGQRQELLELRGRHGVCPVHDG